MLKFISGLSLKEWLWTGAVLAAVVGLGMYTAKVKQWGYDSARQEQDKANKKAGDAAIAGANSVRECIDAGGVWQVTTARCVKFEGQTSP